MSDMVPARTTGGIVRIHWRVLICLVQGLLHRVHIHMCAVVEVRAVRRVLLRRRISLV